MLFPLEPFNVLLALICWLPEAGAEPAAFMVHAVCTSGLAGHTRDVLNHIAPSVPFNMSDWPLQINIALVFT